MKQIIIAGIVAISLGFGSASAEWSSIGSYVPGANGEPRPLFIANNYGNDLLLIGCTHPKGAKELILFVADDFNQRDKVIIKFSPISDPESVPAEIELTQSWSDGDGGGYHQKMILTRTAASIVENAARAVILINKQAAVTFNLRNSSTKQLWQRFEQRCAGKPEHGVGFGDTPLHSAIRRGDDATARRIIASSSTAALCARNSHGRTAADLADILDNSRIWLALDTANAAYHCNR